MKNIRNGEACGPNGISTQVCKSLEEFGVIWLTKLLSVTLNKE